METDNPRPLWYRVVLFVLGVAIVVFSFLFLYPRYILPIIIGLAFPLYLLVTLMFSMPVGFLTTYICLKCVVPEGQRMPIRGLRQWTVACLLGLAYIFSWVFLAFLFDTFAPSLPLFFRSIVLPMYILLVPILILSTRLRDKTEQFLRRIFKEDAD